jgi:hypothetical protein
MPGANTSRSTSSATTGLDPSTQAALDAYRAQAAGRQSMFGPQQMGQFNDALKFGAQTGTEGVEKYFDPFQKEVIGGVNANYDRQRAQAGVAAGDEAVKADAFGGSREAILRGQMMGDVNRDEASTVAGLKSQGWQQALMALMGDRGRAAQFGMGGLNSAVGEQNAIQQGQGYGLQFGGKTMEGKETSTPSFMDRLMQYLQMGSQAAGAAFGA